MNAGAEDPQAGVSSPDPLLVALRAWAVPEGAPVRCQRTPPRGARPGENDGDGGSTTPARGRWRRSVLILDTETTTDPAQRLTYGCYRYGRWRDDGTLAILQEGLFYADDLPETDLAGYATLQAFTAAHPADVAPDRRARRGLRLLSRREFLDAVLWPAVQADALIVGFNISFDLSRLAADVSPARDAYQGGFSFVLWEYRDAAGNWREHRYRPRLRVKQIDSKRALIGLARPRGWRGAFPRPGFLDLRTLAFAVTDRGHSLRSACAGFAVEQGKGDVEQHGVITPEHVAYARQDVAATAALLVKLREEYDRHPIALDPCRALSPASVAKAYDRAMGVEPRLALQPDFPPEVLGRAMSAYYGDRAECAVRRTPVPVVYCDVTSMYPTVNALMELWRFHVAARVEVEDCIEEARAVLANITPETVLDPATWRRLTFFAEVVPDGDVLPVRAQYGDAGGTWNIGVNPFTDDRPHWYAGPDLAASALLTGKAPTIERAFKLVPVGTQAGLRPVALRGAVEVDPAGGDFFKTVIEERKRVKGRPDLPAEERARLDRFLKVLANAGSYGVFVESNPERLPAGESAPVAVYGPDDGPFPARAIRPETPGIFSFPPVAALITAAARLVLALIERLMTELGGVHAFCDTDSMAPIATKDGGLIPCPGGPHRTEDGQEAVRALSWAEVDGIIERLAVLNPYDPAAVPGSILRVEDINFDPETGERRQLWCVAVAAKRYALFVLDADGEPVIPPDGYTRHGLGFLLDPTDRDEGDEPSGPTEGWEAALWEGIVRERLGLPHDPPGWADRPAVARLTVSSPWHLAAFGKANAGKPYADRVKPFNFMLAAPLAHQGRPHGVEPDAPFRLVAPFETDPRKWTRMRWTDLYSGRSYRITTDWPGGGDGVASVQSLGSVAAAYPHHPEPKRLGPDGQPCGKQTEGLLRRRPVRGAGTVCVGKEAHRLVERGLVADLRELLGTYADPRREPWTVDVLPKLRAVAAAPGGMAALAETSGLTPRTLRDIVAGRSRPRTAARTALVALVAEVPSPGGRRCAGCGRAVTEADPRRRYCSKECRERAKQERRKVVNR